MTLTKPKKVALVLAAAAAACVFLYNSTAHAQTQVQPVQTQVYRCGNLYSDEPCGPDAKVVDLLVSQRPAPAFESWMAVDYSAAYIRPGVVVPGYVAYVPRGYGGHGFYGGHMHSRAYGVNGWAKRGRR